MFEEAEAENLTIFLGLLLLLLEVDLRWWDGGDGGEVVRSITSLLFSIAYRGIKKMARESYIWDLRVWRSLLKWSSIYIHKFLRCIIITIYNIYKYIIGKYYIIPLVSYNISSGFYWPNSPSYFEYFIIIRERVKRKLENYRRQNGKKSSNVKRLNMEKVVGEKDKSIKKR